MEYENHLYFTDTSSYDDTQKEYVKVMREQVLAQKKMMASMGCFGAMGAMGGMGGMGGMTMGGMTMGGMGGMGAIGGMGNFGGMGSSSSGHGGMSAMGGMGGFGCMGPPPSGFMASMVTPMPYRNDGHEESPANNTKVANEEVAQDGDEQDEDDA
jgi:hypothetical protein